MSIGISRRRERDGVVDQIVQHSLKPRAHRRQPASVLSPCAVDADFGRSRSHRGFRAFRDQRTDHASTYRGQDEIGTTEFCVDTACVGNFGHQPADPVDIMAGDIEQLGAQLRDLRPLCSDSTALRSDVSGFFNSCETSAAKAFHGVDAMAKRRSHVRDSAGEQTDFVATIRQAWDHDLPVPAQANAHGGPDQRSQRPDNRAGQKQRKQYRYRSMRHRRLSPVSAAHREHSGLRRGRCAWSAGLAPLSPIGVAALMTGVRSGANRLTRIPSNPVCRA